MKPITVFFVSIFLAASSFADYPTYKPDCSLATTMPKLVQPDPFTGHYDPGACKQLDGVYEVTEAFYGSGHSIKVEDLYFFKTIVKQYAFGERKQIFWNVPPEFGGAPERGVAVPNRFGFFDKPWNSAVLCDKTGMDLLSNVKNQIGTDTVLYGTRLRLEPIEGTDEMRFYTCSYGVTYGLWGKMKLRH
jgi:hypothetical protein